MTRSPRLIGTASSESVATSAGKLDVPGVVADVSHAQGHPGGGNVPADAFRADLQPELLRPGLDGGEGGGAQHQVLPVDQEDVDGEILEGGTDQRNRLEEKLVQLQEGGRPAADLRNQLLAVRPPTEVRGQLPQRVEELPPHDAPAQDGHAQRVGDRHDGQLELEKPAADEPGTRKMMLTEKNGAPPTGRWIRNRRRARAMHTHGRRAAAIPQDVMV